MSKQAGSSPDTPPTAVRVGRLDTLPRVRTELSRVYTDARRKAGRDLSPSDASRLAFVLKAIGETLIAQDIVAGINDRLDELEGKQGGRS